MKRWIFYAGDRPPCVVSLPEDDILKDRPGTYVWAEPPEAREAVRHAQEKWPGQAIDPELIKLAGELKPITAEAILERLILELKFYCDRSDLGVSDEVVEEVRNAERLLGRNITPFENGDHPSFWGKPVFGDTSRYDVWLRRKLEFRRKMDNRKL